MAALTLLLPLSGCLKPGEIPVNNGPYIQIYYDGLLDCDVVYIGESGPMVYFQIIGNDEVDLVPYTSASQGEKKAVFDSLSKKHFDYGYYGEDPYANEIIKKCYAKDIVSFEVKSKEDFDVGHPAGTSLKDVMVYDAYTSFPWIKGGYAGDPVFSHFRMMADLVTTDQTTLLSAINPFTLSFSQLPVLNSSIHLIITVVTDDGVIHVFEKEAHF